MSKTWKEQPCSKCSDETIQKAIDRLRKIEARKDIQEALMALREAYYDACPNAQS